MRTSLVMADPFRKFLLLNLVSGGAVLFAVLSFSLFREQRYRGHYLSLANKTDYFRVMHNQAAKKLDNMLRAESESIKYLRTTLLQPLRGRVLEVAVGSAPNLPHYSAEVDLVGLDWSPRMLELAREKAKGRVKLVEGDLCRLPFEDSSFDAVVCTFGLCSTLQPMQALAEMRRVVKSEGLVVLLEHGAADSWYESWQLRLSHYKDLCTSGCNNNQDVDQMVLASGLHIVQRWREDKGRIYAYTLKPNKS